MLSIAIPIFNQDVRTLAYTLAKQCAKAGISYQILCFDDGSTQKFRDLNRELGSKMHINYTEMPENLGRSRIRNWLGKLAGFEYILFLDGDSAVKSKDFISTYVKNTPTNSVIYGGRVYQTRKPARKKVLHWKYGKNRESLSAKNRTKQPYLNFQSNNFLIPAGIFQDLPFDESISGYGYEDLLYAQKLKEKGIEVKHIHNPVLHDGLETNAVFVSKTKKAIENLVLLYKHKSLTETRLTKIYTQLKGRGLLQSAQSLLARFDHKLEANNLSENPSIFYFNLWKLSLFIKLMQS